VINEIGWMGTNASSTDEWIELYNPNDKGISLDGWSLKSGDNSPSIALRGTIAANGFYLLERTDDNTVRGISANQIYSGALNNDPGEKLVLSDNFGQTVDEVDCSSGSWFAGKNEAPKPSMEKINTIASGNNSSNWADNNGSNVNGNDADSNPISGTPGQTNSVAQ
jgi:hypothetical protein